MGRIIIILTLFLMVAFAAGYLYINVLRFRQIENSDQERNARNSGISLLTESLGLMEQSFNPAHDILFYGMLLKSGGLPRARAESYINVELLAAEQARNALLRFLNEKGGGLPPGFRQEVDAEAAAYEAAMARVLNTVRGGPHGTKAANIETMLDELSSLRRRHDELGGRINAEIRRLKADFDRYAEADSRARNSVRSKATRGVILLETLVFLMGLMELAAAGRAAIVSRALGEERGKYKKLMEQAGDTVIITDADTGLVVEINRKGEELLGMRRGEIVGQPHAALFPDAERERYAAMFAETVARGGPDETGQSPKSIILRRGDGVEIPVDLRCSVIAVEGRRLVQGIYRDMTAQRAHEKLMKEQAEAQMELVRQTVEALEDARDERRKAEEANRLKSEFVANMSHELRTPLTSVLGYSRIARERMDEVMGALKTIHHRAAPGGERSVTVALPPDEMEEMSSRAEQAAAEISMFNEVVVGQGERLLQLVNDLLDMSSLEAGQLKLQEHISSARMILHSVSNRLAAAAGDKKIRLTTNIDELRDADIFFLGDTSRIEQVLYNLIQNAIKYSAGGEVRATAAAANGHLLFRVRDEGIGIPAKDREAIFDAFRQLDGGSTRAQGGVGLGLTLSRKLITAMGGTINVESAEGRGSEFTVTLPYRPVEN
ncbi:MAG: PAS domain S-box protein [Nitrospinae bacterium]|nr:PAS domain S-box protein [Nitrospinota bacterium]